MNLTKITDLTDILGLSSRTLRYYEEAGLITSIRPTFEKYRYYDEKNIERLQQIIILRKMQIPIKDIQRIYQNEDMSILVESFTNRIREIDDEIVALSELKLIVDNFLQKMLQNGISKISALPILYDEMNRQLTFSQVEPGLHKPLSLRIINLPPMEMITSLSSDISDMEMFWNWLDNQGFLNNVEEHSLFEMQNEDGDIHLAVKKASVLINENAIDIYREYHFPGGLFAVKTIKYDSEFKCILNDMSNSFTDNPCYEIDYQHDRQILIESVLSPDGRNDLIDLMVPLKRKFPNTSYFSGIKLVVGMSSSEIISNNKILKQTYVHDFIPINDPFYLKNDDIVEFISYISVRKLSTNVTVRIPFRVDIEFMVDETSNQYGYGADEGSIRIDYGNCYFGINMECNPDKALSKEAIKFTEPLSGKIVTIPKLGHIQNNVYNYLTWIVGEKYFAVIINNEVRYCATNLPYMQADLGFMEPNTIMIGSNGQGKRYFKEVSVSQLQQTPKLNFLKGEIIMSSKQSNNVITNLHQVVTLHYGENYWFNGCAKYVMECLGKPEYDYEFFAGLTGDNFTQIYYKDHFRGDSATDYLLCNTAEKELPIECGGKRIEKIFNQIGYACTYVPNRKIKENREMFLQTLIGYIDKGIPVIRYHWLWNVIVGYEDYGKTLLIMEKDDQAPIKIAFDRIFDIDQENPDSFADTYGYGWFFIGEKLQDVSLSKVYRNAIENLPKQLTIDNSYFVFGAGAFRNWASNVEKGYFDSFTPEQFDIWTMYLCYVCAMATNSGGVRNYLDKAMETNPDLIFLEDIKKFYQKTGEIWNNQNGEDLEAIGGGFNVTLATLQNPVKRAKIAKKLYECAECMDQVLHILKLHLDKNGKLPEVTK